MVKKVVWYVILFIVVQYVALALVTVGNILINGKDAEMGTPQMLLMQGIFSVICVALFLGLRWLDFLPDLAGEELLDFIRHRWGYLVVCILAPLAEEVIFRGAVLRTMLEHWEGNKRWTAITISALLFALAHMNPAQMPHAFLLGLLIGWLYERSRSLIPCVVLHCANNTIAYLMTAAYPAPDITLRDILGGSARAEWMAIGFSIMILIPALYQLSIRLKR